MLVCPKMRRQSPRPSAVKSKAATTLLCAALAGTGTLLNGCARGVATTTVAPNGAWTRKVTFHGAKPDNNGGAMGTKIEDAILVPQGAEWKITRQDKEDEKLLTIERSMPLGGALHGDIMIKGGKKGPSPIAVNDVSVQQTAPGVFVYKETLHWKGDAAKELTPDKDAIADIKKALPPAVATDANASALAGQFAREFWRVLFGPGDPLLSNISSLMMQPEIAERRIQQRMGADIDKILIARFGAQLSAAQRLDVTRKLIGSSLDKVSTKSKSSGPGGGGNANKDDSPDAGMVALVISVKMPGRITATNGERDAFNGDVYWSLYPQAAVLGDVMLTATCDTNAQTAAK